MSSPATHRLEVPVSTPRRGRPSKGDRHPFSTRIRRPVADRLIAEADARGMSWGEYIEAVVARAHGFDVAIPAKVKDDVRQEELGISA